MNSSRARLVAVPAILLAGLAMGAVGALAAKLDGPIFHVVSIVFSGGWSWACFAFLVGYFRQSKVAAALLASSALAVGVVVYYLSKALSPVAPIGMDVAGESSVGDAAPGILFWGIAAFLFGAPVGLFGNLARIPGIAGLSFRLLIPLIAFYETSVRLGVEEATAGPVPAATWSVIRVLAALAAVALVGHTLWRWRTRRDSLKVGAESH
ncbi:hypothetical protein OG321_36835 [Streptomyces sp. NBC_00424]|uniref:hypothetical protein n=1 Tax=Streptomyces sp. NBC_00424 TaxID=2903648 RepID=UPI00225AB52C|nr:hypothetical protein [Streptomyces sp. NBC_00424]MCX5078018.1 hypothetical protein [Streptomyces sp. NBC_00424]